MTWSTEYITQSSASAWKRRLINYKTSFKQFVSRLFSKARTSILCPDLFTPLFNTFECYGSQVEAFIAF